MMDAIKKGFGLTVGHYIAVIVVTAVVGTVVANTDEVMDDLKENNPKLYNRIKGYRFK